MSSLILRYIRMLPSLKRDSIKKVCQVYLMFVLRSRNQLELPCASFRLSLCLQGKYAGPSSSNYMAFHINELIRPK